MTKQKGSIVLAVLIGAFISALAAMTLLVTMQYNLKAARAERLKLQAEMLADSAIEDMIAYVRSVNATPLVVTDPAWTTISAATVKTLIASPETSISATGDIYYKEINAADYYGADKAFYGVMVTDNQTQTDYDIFGFGLVQLGSQDSIVQKYKKIFKSTSATTINVFVESSESRSFLTVFKP